MSKLNIVVKVRDAVEMPLSDETYQSVSIPPWSLLAANFPEVRVRRLLFTLRPSRIRELMERADKSGDYHAPNFLNYFVVELPQRSNGELALKILSEASFVETAYVDHRPELAGMMPPGGLPAKLDPIEPRAASQHHLDPADVGVDARFAWDCAGGTGVGQRLFTIGLGWALDHEDLVSASRRAPQLLGGGENLTFALEHGTPMLGSALSAVNGVGGIGVAPSAEFDVVSFFFADISGLDLRAAIGAALDSASPGDVIMLEARAPQRGEPPVEIAQAEYDVISWATALDVAVIEPAGNGDTDLDTFPLLQRGARADSGAIIVAAATAGVPHAPIRKYLGALPVQTWGTNFGSRVDCNAWGEKVVACNSFLNQFGIIETAQYTERFFGTSAATAIIAGVALAVQGIASKLGPRLRPADLRRVLCAPETGTPSHNGAADRIGVMPDLKKIIELMLGLTK